MIQVATWETVFSTLALSFRCPDPAWQHRRTVVRGHLSVGVVEDDLALAGMFEYPGLEVVRHDSWTRSAEGFEHSHMRPQPGVLLHVQGRFDEDAYRLNGRQPTNKYTGLVVPVVGSCSCIVGPDQSTSIVCAALCPTLDAAPVTRTWR